MAASCVLAQPLGPAPYLCVVHQNLPASEVQHLYPLCVSSIVYRVFLPTLGWHFFVASLVHSHSLENRPHPPYQVIVLAAHTAPG